MIKILSKKHCYDNMMNRVKITARLSNNTTMIVYKTPIWGGPYSYFFYIISK
jgi:hypothetical protein